MNKRRYQMLNVTINLCKRNEYECSPVLLVNDESGEQVPIILPECMEIAMAEKMCNSLKNDIETNYTDINTLRIKIYGQ